MCLLAQKKPSAAQLTASAPSLGPGCARGACEPLGAATAPAHQVRAPALVPADKVGQERCYKGRSRERSDGAASVPIKTPPRCTISPLLSGDLAAVTCVAHCRPSLGPALAARREPNRAQHNPTKRAPHAATQACDQDHRWGRYRFYGVAGRCAGSRVAHHGESLVEGKGRHRKTHAPWRRRRGPPLLREPSRAPGPPEACCRRGPPRQKNTPALQTWPWRGAGAASQGTRPRLVVDRGGTQGQCGRVGCEVLACSCPRSAAEKAEERPAPA